MLYKMHIIANDSGIKLYIMSVYYPSIVNSNVYIVANDSGIKFYIFGPIHRNIKC